MIGLPGETSGCPLDRMNRHFRADRQDALWVSEFTYVSTWQGFAYVVSVQHAGGYQSSVTHDPTRNPRRFGSMGPCGWCGRRRPSRSYVMVSVLALGLF